MSLKESLQNDEFVVSCEILNSSFENLLQSSVNHLQEPSGNVTGISFKDMVLDCLVGDSIDACDLIRKMGFGAIYRTDLRNKNRLELQKDLMSVHDLGVRDLLVFTEDYRISGTSLIEEKFFHVDSGKLASVADHLKRGRTIDGRTLMENVEFFMGAGIDLPIDMALPKQGMEQLESLKQMGVGYFITTPVFNINRFEKHIKQIKEFNIPVIAEVIILKTAAMGKFINRHFKSGLVPEWFIQKLLEAQDKTRASIELFTETVKGLKDVCQGVHVITIGGENKLEQYLNAAKLR